MSTPAITEQSLGKRGSTVITGGPVTGSFAIIVAGPSGATLDAITCSNKTGASNLVGTLPAGYTSYGNFTSITVSAGSIEAYNA
jgi:hypothetical protein|tara:strand:- start:193 stop:444 length:252 start_codon:yes stop_codon:yes gene_type:complete